MNYFLFKAHQAIQYLKTTQKLKLGVGYVVFSAIHFSFQ